MKKIFYNLFFGALSFALLIQQASAASIGLSLSQSVFDAEILPGTAYHDQIVVYNSSTEEPLPLHLQLSVWDLAENSEEDISFIATEDAINPLKWFSLMSEDDEVVKSLEFGHDFILAPGEEERIRFRVRPPDDVAAGTYLASMRFQTALPEHYYETTGGPRFVPEVVALFFLKVPLFALDGEQTSYAAEIVDIGLKDTQQSVPGVVQVAHADILDDAAKTIAAKVRNTGAFYFKARGVLSIHSWTGRIVKEIALPPKYMLPGKVRTIEVPLSPDREAGFFSRVGKYFADNSYFGKYTATMVLHYPQAGDGAEFASRVIAEKDISFWIFPWKLILIIAAVVALCTIFIKQFGGRIKRAARVLFSAITRRSGGN